jgi:metal-dependent HD superfamily phosphatase/phosphodiesterase
MKKYLTFEEIKNNLEIKTYLEFIDNTFIEYKEYGMGHALYSAKIAEKILKSLGYDNREQELAKIAAYVHDIGNMVSKYDHDQSSAIMLINILGESRCNNEEIFTIITAIGCHEDKTVDPVSPIAAALVLGDKTDVCHERLRVDDLYYIDKHSNVIAACQKVDIVVNKKKKTIELRIKINTRICSVMDYFELFLSRINYCRKASNILDCNFELYINKDKFL